MWYELERLITKYGGRSDEVSQDLIALLTEHQNSLGIIPDESLRLPYEELMTYHLAYPPFFPDQKPPGYHTDAYFPFQREFNESRYHSYHRRMLKETDATPKRIMTESNERMEMEADVLGKNYQEGNTLLNENDELDINENSAFFKRADEILRKRRLDQIKSMMRTFVV